MRTMMKRVICMALALMLSSASAFALMSEITYCVPRTIESLEDSPFHIAKMLLAEQGITMNIQETFGTTDTKMVATNQAQFCGPGPFYVMSAVAEGDQGNKLLPFADLKGVMDLLIMQADPAGLQTQLVE